MRATKLADQLLELLARDVSVDPALRNSWELAVWHDLLGDRRAQRRSRGTQKWWGEVIAEVRRTLQESRVTPRPTCPTCERRFRPTSTTR